VVGVPGTARRPEVVRERARVGGFTTFRTDRILALEPDLVLAFSDLQKDIVAELIAAGVAVLCTNQRSFDDVLRAILTIGGVLGAADAARSLVQDIRDEIKQYREYSAGWPDRPRVYFEEWMDPLVAGIRWVSELIEIAGGQDVFAELREGRSARERVVSASRYMLPKLRRVPAGAPLPPSPPVRSMRSPAKTCWRRAPRCCTDCGAFTK
jgi:iron complex transport system substrate-binding protein